MLLLEGHTSPVYALAFSPDGRYLASGDKAERALLWDDAMQPEMLWDPGDSTKTQINAIDFRPDGQALMIVTGRKWFEFRTDDVRHFNLMLQSGRPLFRSSVATVRFLTTDLLAVGLGHRDKPEAGALELWHVAKDVRREPRFASPHGVRAVAVHPPTRRVAWSEWGGSQSGPRLTVWDIVSPDQTRFHLTHNCPSLSFHPDGDRLAAAVEWGVKVFDMTRKQERLALKGHKGVVSGVAYSPDGRTLATGSWDGTVRLWDPESGAERACYQWPVGKVFALAYSPDGLRLAAAGEKGTIAMWDVD